MDSFDKLRKEMEKIQKQVSGEVAFSELFNESFMQQYTEYDSLESFFSENGFHVTTKEELEAIPDEEIDKVVEAKTKFDSWEEMYETAGKLYMKKKLKSLGLDVR